MPSNIRKALAEWLGLGPLLIPVLLILLVVYVATTIQSTIKFWFRVPLHETMMLCSAVALWFLASREMRMLETVSWTDTAFLLVLIVMAWSTRRSIDRNHEDREETKKWRESIDKRLDQIEKQDHS